MKNVIAYSPPYGENYLKELEVFSFMHTCGIDAVKLILSNSFSRLGIPYSPYPLIWRGPGDYDFSVVDRQIGDIVRQNPHVRFIAMIDLNSPPWIKETMKRDSFQELGECFLDPRWLTAVEEYQEKLVEHLEKNHADRVFAYYIACGRTQEWFDLNWCSPTPRRVAHYKKWCGENGRKLLPVPSENEHLQCKDDFLPEHIIQWKEYGNSLTCECAVHFFKRIKKQIRPGVKIGGVFGNIHDIGSDGHFEAEKFCRESGCDFYIGPSCNSEIPMGGGSGFQSSQLMLKRFGIGYLHSCDRQLSTTAVDIGPGIRVPASGLHARQKNAQEDVTCLKREFGISLVHGFSLWFFNIWGGSYSGEEVRAQLKQFGTLWQKYSRLSSGSDAETLLVYSPEAGLRHPPVDLIGSRMRRTLLPSADMPFNTAAVSDLYEADLSGFKVIVFLNTNYLNENDLQMIRKKVCCENRVVIWCHTPGIASEKGFDRSRMEKVCGFPCGTGGMAQKDEGNWYSALFADIESCTPEALRALGRRAGLHFFTEDPDLKVWSSKEFLSAHTRDGGLKEIKLKKKVRRVTELYSGKTVAENCDCFTDGFAAPDTKLYYFEY